MGAARLLPLYDCAKKTRRYMNGIVSPPEHLNPDDVSANICELHTSTSNVSNLEDGHDVKSIPLLYRRTTNQ
jgi:hypothetical protein